jgi:hypothetical protein
MARRAEYELRTAARSLQLVERHVDARRDLAVDRERHIPVRDGVALLSPQRLGASNRFTQGF